MPETPAVAVIDSGVNPRHPPIERIAGGVSINVDGTFPDDLLTCSATEQP